MLRGSFGREASYGTGRTYCRGDGCRVVAVTGADATARPGPPVLGILAGGGRLPGRVAAAAAAGGREVFIVGLDGFADPAVLARWPHEVIRIGAAGRILAALRARRCRDLVLIGAVRRPSFFDLRPDAEGLRLLARAGRAAFAGDDGALAAVIKVLGEEGFNVIGVHDILNEAMAPAGVLGAVAPDAQAMADIQRGVMVARALGAVDVGQGCVVQHGLVLAVEAIEGTDAMLARCAALARSGPGGVLVKLVKPAQDRRTDLPTIGLETVRAAVAAGLRGIAFAAGDTLLADRAAAIDAADKAGLFLLGLDPATSATAGTTEAGASEEGDHT
jgi:UDP-2,3-diacylglucosamine hydrolase